MSVLVQRSVKRTLFGMAFPMLAGTFALNAYNLTDTWFVSRLGTEPLAAMGFSFPVVMLVSFLAGGLGTGVTTLMSHALGRRDREAAKRLTSHGLLLVVTVAASLAVVGCVTVAPVFSALGASGRVLSLVGGYMRIWFVGAPLMALPMLGNGLLISAGDSRAAGRFMMLGPALNLVLDPLLIFGWLGLPAWGVRGAAAATVLAQGASATWLLVLLYRKHRLLVLRRWPFRDYSTSCRRIFALGVPAILSMMLMPISTAVITWLLASIGSAAVAAAGAAQRLEMFAFVIPMALGMSLTPFVSQNYGAERWDRIRDGFSLSARFAIGYGGLVAVSFFAAARLLARVFSDDPAVIAVMVTYIRIVSFGYGMMEVHRYCGFVLTGLHRPVASALLNALRVLGALIPLSILGAHLWGVVGLFAARLTTDLLVGSVGLIWIRRVLRVRPPRERPDASGRPA